MGETIAFAIQNVIVNHIQEGNMSYQKAEKVLPMHLIQMIQQYVDGETIYIPKKEENKQTWGSQTTIRQELASRNTLIYRDYLLGDTLNDLADKYCLSIKSVQRVVLQRKKMNNDQVIKNFSQKSLR